MDFSSYWLFAIIICWHQCNIKDKHSIYYQETHTCAQAQPTVYSKNDYSFKLWFERCEPKVNSLFVASEK